MTKTSSRTQADDRPARALHSWLSAIDTSLRSFEHAAWDLRGAVDALNHAWHTSKAGFREQAQRSAEGGDLRRSVHTASVLTGLLFERRLARLRDPFVSRNKAEREWARMHRRHARRFRQAAEQHGGAVLKLGQLLSARPDLMPKPWVEELAKLQDAAPPMPFETVVTVVEANLGGPLGQWFLSFDPEPIGCASIGQVHKGVLLDGTAVAVKVQRPGIARLIASDMNWLRALLTANASTLPLDVETVSAELESALLAEVDYAKEVRALQEIGALLAQHTGMRAPTAYPALCGPQLITTSFVEGEKITLVLDRLRAHAERGDAPAQARISLILGRLLEAYLRQVLCGGLFQADPHPGNLLVQSDDTVVLLDYGCSRSLDAQTQQQYFTLLHASLTSNRQGAVDALSGLGFVTESGRPETLLVFTDALLGELRGAFSGALRWPDRKELFERLSSLRKALSADPVRHIPDHFVLVARVFATLGGLFTHYRPDLDIATHIVPVLAEAARKHTGPATAH